MNTKQSIDVIELNVGQSRAVFTDTNPIGIAMQAHLLAGKAPVTFFTPQAARDAARMLDEAATTLEELQAAAEGLRVFEVTLGPMSLAADEWWIGEQTEKGREGVRMFALPATGEHASNDLRIGSTWNDEGHNHVVIARGRFSAKIKCDGKSYDRYIEIPTSTVADLIREARVKGVLPSELLDAR